MFGKTSLITADSLFGQSRAFVALETLAFVQTMRARRENRITAALAAIAFSAAFAAVLIIGA